MMDEQMMDVIEHGEPIDLDGPEAQPRYGRTETRKEQIDAARQRASARLEDAQRQAMELPLKVMTGAIGALPVQTREHLRLSARESLLAVTSFWEAVGSAGLEAVERVFADSHSATTTANAQPRRIVIERDDA